MPLAAWQVHHSGPKRLAAGAVSLEKDLEGWIEVDPGLLDPGLLVIQRQMHIDGRILDVLCVDPQGRPTVVEIKRGKLIRETIAQGLDYASSIAAMPTETLRDRVHHYLQGNGDEHPGLNALLDSKDDTTAREVAVVVVGVGKEPGLERMIDFLGSRFGVPIRAVTFDVFDLPDGQKVLVREETEPLEAPSHTSVSAYSVSSVIELAGGPHSENGERMLLLADAAERNGLFVRPYKWSLMFTPATKKTRYLFTIWKWSDKDELAISYSAPAIAEFFPISAEGAVDTIGLPEGRHGVRSDADAQAWAKRIDTLFARIAASGSEDSTSTGDGLVPTTG